MTPGLYNPYLPVVQPTIADVMSQYNEQFMLTLMVISIAFFIYTSYNIFFRKPRPIQRPIMEQLKRYEANPKLLLYDGEDGFARTFDELMFLPAIFLMMFVGAYYTGVWI